MLPWCNRIKGGKLRFQGKEYQLRTTKDDGTARHGDTRGRAWRLDERGNSHIRMSLQSDVYPDMNWPFKFSAWAEYRLDGRDFIWTLALKNEDSRPMPGGFGHHPYFARTADAQVQIPCDQYFELTDFMATGSPVPIAPEVDFRQMRDVPESEINHLLTGRKGTEPSHIKFPQHGIEVAMHSDSLFEHILIYAPQVKPFFAVEPMTNASDGFNLYENSIAGSGIFVLQPGEEKIGTVRLSLI
jgi:aldose 1-epimerase